MHQCHLWGSIMNSSYFECDFLQIVYNLYGRWTTRVQLTSYQCHFLSDFRYNENSHNCYTFVLAFLQKLEHDLLSNAANSSIYFCEKFILPRTTAAGKYISLYRKLRAVDCYIHGGPDVNLRPYQEPVPSR